MNSRLSKILAVTSHLLLAVFIISAQQPAAVPHRMLVLYFDPGSAAYQAQALASATKFVQTSLQPTDTVAIMALAGGTVSVKQDFTGDRAQLAKALTHLAGEDLAGAVPQSEDRRIAALTTAFRMLGRLPEKKAMIYFTASYPAINDAQGQASINAAIQANVAIFPVDVRGLTAQPGK